MICRQASQLQPWRKALVSNALIVISHFATLLLTEWATPHSIFTLGQERSLALLLLHFSSLSLGSAVLVLASHKTWALHRRVFETRCLGRFKLVSRIAEGGHGEVWSAYDSAVHQQVAIKVLRNDVASDARAVARFALEIDALCKLRHPHTIRILDFGVSKDGVAYYAMELLHGCTLAELVAAEGPLPPMRVVHLLLQAAHALAEAHGHGIVHRDIKPENLFVLQSELSLDFVKVLDFGIAKHNAGTRSAAALTRTGMVIGTPAFMAPEVTTGHAADTRADVYSLGAVGYFLLTGAVPVASPGEVPCPPSQLLAHALPELLEAAIMRCLRVAPGQRFADAAELARALGALPEAQHRSPDRGTASGAALTTRTHPCSAATSPSANAGHSGTRA